MTESHVYALKFLPKLLDLNIHLSSRLGWNETALSPLRHLASLTSLEIHVSGLSTPLLVAPELAHLTQLKQLTLSSWGSIWSPQRATNQDHLFETISQLTQLTKLALRSMLESVPAEIASLAQLQSLHLQEANRDHLASIMGLQIQDVVNAPMAFPASLMLCSQLQEMCLVAFSPASVIVWRSICESLAALPGLVSLTVIDTELQAVPDCDWVLSSRLTHLSLSSCGMTRMPHRACQLPDLQSLSINGSALTQLDDGPYLTSIHHLAIQCDSSTTGSEVLGRAGQLKRVSIVCNSLDPSKQGCFSRPHLQSLLPAACTLRMFEQQSGAADPP